MAKKSFLGKESRKLSDVLNQNANMSNETKDAIMGINKPDDVTVAIKKVESDAILTVVEKTDIINRLKEEYISLFNFNNCPEDYESLKAEAKFLAGITQYSFLLMAQRLVKIRDEKLYEKDNYDDFKSFIEGEIKIKRTMAYNYIDIVSFFGVQALEHEENLEYSKLIPIIPLLKTERDDIPREEIKKAFIEKARSESFRDITEDARELKVKYGLSKQNSNNTNIKSMFMKFVKKLPDRLTVNEIKDLREIGTNIGLIVDQNKMRGGVLEDWKETFVKNV